MGKYGEIILDKMHRSAYNRVKDKKVPALNLCEYTAQE